MPYRLNIFTGKWDLVNAGGDGGTTVIGGGDMRTDPAIEAPNGALTTFTVPNEYAADSLSVFINGVKEPNITEISSTQFTISEAPIAGDTVDLIYQLLGGDDEVPAGALLDEAGDAILDEAGDYIEAEG